MAESDILSWKDFIFLTNIANKTCKNTSKYHFYNKFSFSPDTLNKVLKTILWLNKIFQCVLAHNIHNLFLSIFWKNQTSSHLCWVQSATPQFWFGPNHANLTKFNIDICIGCTPAGCTAVPILWCLEAGKIKKTCFLNEVNPQGKSQFCYFHLLFQFHSKMHACLARTQLTKDRKVKRFLLATEVIER